MTENVQRKNCASIVSSIDRVCKPARRRVSRQLQDSWSPRRAAGSWYRSCYFVGSSAHSRPRNHRPPLRSSEAGFLRPQCSSTSRMGVLSVCGWIDSIARDDGSGNRATDRTRPCKVKRFFGPGRGVRRRRVARARVSGRKVCCAAQPRFIETPHDLSRLVALFLSWPRHWVCLSRAFLAIY